MAINPLLTHSTQPSVITESITRLLAQLPQSVQLPATLKASESNTLLRILSGTPEKPNSNNNNSLQKDPNQALPKPILVQLPKINLASLRNINAELPIVVTILQKLPVLKLQLALIETISSNQSNAKSLVTQNQQAASNVSSNTKIQPATTPLAELTISPKLKAQIKLLISNDLPLKQIKQLILQSKTIHPNLQTEKLYQNQKTGVEPITNQVLKNDSSANFFTSKVSTNVPISWPQHAALEKLSQSIITAKLLQLNQQLPANIKDPFVKVLQSWIKQLATTNNNAKFLDQFIQNPKQNPNTEIKASLKQQAPLWEASIRKQINQQSLVNNKTPKENVSNNNVKAQILKIIQSLPVILARLNPAAAAKTGAVETEVWQMIFKTRQLIQQQLQTAIPTSGNLNQPELAINFLEQNLRLLILWLRNIEQQQSEQQRQQPSSQQQSSSSSTNNFRFELPMPASTNSEMVQIEIEQQQKNQAKKKNKWKWKLKIQFDFGEHQKLITKTHVNPKQVLIQFEGSPHYQQLITTQSMQQLAQSLEAKTGLNCNVEFHLEQALSSSNSNQSFNLEA